MDAAIERVVCDLCLSGLTRLQVAKQLNIGTRTVSRVLSKYKIRMKVPARLISPEKYKQVCKMYEDGLSVEQISRSVGHHLPEVYRVLRLCNVTLRLPRRLFPEEEVNICKAYLSGMSATEVSRVFGETVTRVRRVLLRNNIVIRQSRKLTLKQEKEVCKLYEENDLRPWQIAEKFGVDKDLVAKTVRRNNGQVRTAREGRRILSLDESVFDEPLSQEAKYWAGFLLGDGWIGLEKDSWIFELRLAKKDIGHIYKFRGFLRSNHKVSIKVLKPNEDKKLKTRTSVGLRIRSKKLVKRLIDCGVGFRKTYVAKVPKHLKTSIDFWRGLIDADGSISYTCEGYPLLSLCGTQEVVSQFKEFCCEIVGNINVKVRQHNLTEVLYTFTVSGRRAKDLIKTFYVDASVYLNRKYQKAMEISEMDAPSRFSRISPSRYSKLIPQQVLDIRSLKGVYSYAEIAKRFDSSYQTICNVMNGKTWSWVSVLDSINDSK